MKTKKFSHIVTSEGRHLPYQKKMLATLVQIFCKKNLQKNVFLTLLNKLFRCLLNAQNNVN